MSINVDKLAIAVMENLEIYLANTQEGVDAAVLETAKETVEELNRTSPRRPQGGEYAESWDQKMDNKSRGKWWMSRIVYAKSPNYRLTHLLEFGHAKVNGGRAPAQPHIRQAEENAATRLYTKLIRKLRYND